MTEPAPRGDEATISVLVKVTPEEAFRIFTSEINAWWRGGLKYRVGRRRSVLHLEPKLGGRLFEAFETSSGESKVIETGRVTTWQPPRQVVFDWRAVNFATTEKTEVDVRFEPTQSGTLVTVRHRGWSRIRADHPARHGQDTSAFLRALGMWWAGLISSLREYADSDERLPGSTPCD